MSTFQIKLRISNGVYNLWDENVRKIKKKNRT